MRCRPNATRSFSKAGVAPKEQYDQMKANADAQMALVHADEAAVQSAKLQVEYCKIYAPTDGRTGALQVYPGNIVKAERRADADRDQPDFADLRGFLGSGAIFGHREKVHERRAACTWKRRPTARRSPRSGYLTFVDNTVDNTTGTIKLKGTFPNEDHRLWPGQFSTVSVALGGG